jgi:hypothetical protein
MNLHLVGPKLCAQIFLNRLSEDIAIRFLQDMEQSTGLVRVSLSDVQDAKAIICRKFG